MAKSKHSLPERQRVHRPEAVTYPTFDDYFNASDGLARTVRMALDQRGTVSRAEVRRALERYEQVIRASEQEANST